MRRRSLVLLAGAMTAVGVGAQQSAPFRADRPFHSSIETISITATVLDAGGRLVTGLPREAFTVYEDGQEQTITQFTRERVPVALGVLLDGSDSMYGERIREARAAVDRFLFELLDGSDEFFLLAFNHEPQVVTPWSNVPVVVRSALERVRPSGGTAIYDAILAALPRFETRSRQRAAFLLISDGADTASDRTLSQVRSALLRSDAFAYAIAIDPPDRRPINTAANPTALREITDDSGGRTEIVRDTGELHAATARIAEELNNQYVLGYTAPRPPDGKYHSIRVRVRGAEYRVRSRRGYVADTTGVSNK